MRFSLFGYTALGVVLVAASAQANGFSRGAADTDILYEEGNFNIRAGATVVMPSHKFSAASDPRLVGTNYLDNYVIPSAALKLGLTENLACAGTYTDAYGAASSFDVPYGPSGKESEEFIVNEFGLTCAVFVDVGQGRLSVLGGGFLERFDYDLSAAPPLLGGAPLDVGLESDAYGWRAGLGYEIPDIALRAQLMYRSGTKHEATGIANTPFGPAPAFGEGELPQSVELEVQSGIAPGWLAFGSVKWTDWSVNETLDFSIAGFQPQQNQYYWRDGWTVTGGLGHSFSEDISGVVSLQWDRGVSTGYDFRSDRWRLAGGVNMSDSIGGELRLGGGATYLASATIDQPDADHYGDAVDSGWAGFISASYSVNW
ncbi:outer membrane protein transport protein [Chelativorans sp. YIM 93263]|uniref:outer membrane protein transport protein n=1 Tax=Chelativorans sp. YIM 93263 TaxID=2906648 RepID=UPI00237898EA|nr:aromatic hydrocarbon degradation protein [Chelativorans sp. YIM 93263]